MSTGPFSLIPASVRNAASSAVVKDAGTKVTVSISLIAALAYGAYTLGAKQSEKVAAIEVTLARVTTILERMEQNQTEAKSDVKELRRDISVIEGRTSGIRGDLEALDSKIK